MNSSAKRLLVTGAGGFVGAAICREAVRAGHVVLAMTRPGGNIARLSDLMHGVERVELDLGASDAEMVTVMRAGRPDVIVHAAWGGVSSRARMDHAQITDNVGPSCRLLLAAREAGASKFVGIGSQGEYGLMEGKIRETDLTSPTTLYGASKLAVYHLTRQLAAQEGIGFAWLRLFSTYGPGDNPNWLIPSLIETVLNGERPKTTLGEQLWDWLFIDDVARAIVAAAVNADASGVFNLGSGQPVKVRGVVEKIRDLVSPGLELVFGEVPYRPDQVWHMEADVTRLKAATTWSPRVDIDAGLAVTVDWHRARRQPA